MPPEMWVVEVCLFKPEYRTNLSSKTVSMKFYLFRLKSFKDQLLKGEGIGTKATRRNQSSGLE